MVMLHIIENAEETNDCGLRRRKPVNRSLLHS
jgi:hypothetical protein